MRDILFAHLTLGLSANFVSWSFYSYAWTLSRTLPLKKRVKNMAGISLLDLRLIESHRIDITQGF